MKVRLIIVDDRGIRWIEDAWDFNAMDDNHAGYLEKVKEAEESGVVRLIDVTIPNSAIEAAFAPTTIVAPDISIPDQLSS